MSDDDIFAAVRKVILTATDGSQISLHSASNERSMHRVGILNTQTYECILFRLNSEYLTLTEVG